MPDPLTQLEAPPSAKAQEILQAARGVFIAKGFEAASMDAVAREAGVSKATVYAHFKSKSDLFAAMMTTILLKRMGTKLDRDVAIKILPESFSADPDRLSRFAQESRATRTRYVAYASGSGPLKRRAPLARRSAANDHEGVGRLPHYSKLSIVSALEASTPGAVSTLRCLITPFSSRAA